MIQAGECSSTLRVLGQFLEQIDAAEIGIIDHEEYIEVSWRNRRGGREERYHDAGELAALRTASTLYRDAQEPSHRYGLTELLRTLGQELDDLRMDSVAIAATPDGFHASGTVAGSEIIRTYTHSELVGRAQAYRRERALKTTRA
jgi:hypothetical protein